MQTEFVPVHLVPPADLGKLGTRCLACGVPLDLSHTHPPFRYATDEVARAVIARSAGTHVCTLLREPVRA
jgi:hypothetical protein